MSVWPDVAQPRTVKVAGAGSRTLEWTVPPGLAFDVQSVVASIDAGGSDSDPELLIIAPGGEVIAAKRQAETIPAGDTGLATWARRLVDETAGVTPTPGMCRLLGSGNGTATLTLTLDAAVPADGVLQVVFAQTTVNDNTDTASAPSNVADSQGVAGWTWITAAYPLIGLIRQTGLHSGGAGTSQVGSVARDCTTADLGIGDTITVTFATANPGAFHTAGLIVWQQAYGVAVTQGGIVEYGFGDQWDGVAISASRLSWLDDYGVGMGAPERDALTITAMGAYPAQSGFAPINGTLIGEIATGTVSIACHCMGVPELTRPDPGGDWPAAAEQLMGNYQTVRPRVFG